SSFGCDSVVHLTLTVTPRIISNLERTICEGSSLTVGTHVYSTGGTYSDTLVSSFGCDSVVHLTLTVKMLPVIDAIVDKPEIMKGETVQLDINSNEIYTYHWQPENLVSNADIQNPMATVENSVWFYVLATDQIGCGSVDSVFVQVNSLECGEDNVYIANAFTPNGDKYNDLFLIQSLVPLQEMALLIYNRWGELVFESTDQSIGWDGNYKGMPAVGDSFAYYFRGICGSIIIVKKGNILMIR
ncbi:MAG: gliding motility-associated C-terminal domain-containing protein, partial [Chitinophagales bacterium]|nr:gliding motility-associated C-terminal domain-containing protein [Chitinophagales bacterium]